MKSAGLSTSPTCPHTLTPLMVVGFTGERVIEIVAMGAEAGGMWMMFTVVAPALLGAERRVQLTVPGGADARNVPLVMSVPPKATDFTLYVSGNPSTLRLKSLDNGTST